MSWTTDAMDIWDDDDAEPVTPPRLSDRFEGPTVEDLEALAEPCYGTCAGCGQQQTEVFQVGERWLCWTCKA